MSNYNNIFSFMYYADRDVQKNFANMLSLWKCCPQEYRTLSFSLICICNIHTDLHSWYAESFHHAHAVYNIGSDGHNTCRNILT